MAGWNLTGNAVSAEFDGSDEQERKELSVSQAVEIAAGALDAIPQLERLGRGHGFRGPNARSGHCYFRDQGTIRPPLTVSFEGCLSQAHVRSARRYAGEL